MPVSQFFMARVIQTLTPWLQPAAKFVVSYAMLTLLIEFAHAATWLNSYITGTILPPAAWLIRHLHPAIQVFYAENYLVVPGARMSVLRGCDALDVIALLYSAILATPAAWRKRLAGMVIGGAIVYALNTVRVVFLFSLWYVNSDWFAPVHGLFAPLLLIVCTGFIFHGWLQLTSRRNYHATQIL